MNKKYFYLGMTFFFIIIALVLLASSQRVIIKTITAYQGATQCTESDWQCTEWARVCEYSGGYYSCCDQRNCTDSTGSCDPSTKPSTIKTETCSAIVGPEPQPATSPCTEAAYSCTEWGQCQCTDEGCTSGQQYRECTLVNTTCSNPGAVFPGNAQSCTPQTAQPATQNQTQNQTVQAQACVESWDCGMGWGECKEGIQTQSCTDKNNCGTTNSKPKTSRSCQTTDQQTAPTAQEDEDAALFQACLAGGMDKTQCCKNFPQYVLCKQEQLGCKENWVPGPWGVCVEGIKTRNVLDKNNCGTTQYRPEDTIECALSAPEFGGRFDFDFGISEVGTAAAVAAASYFAWKYLQERNAETGRRKRRKK